DGAAALLHERPDDLRRLLGPDVVGARDVEGLPGVLHDPRDEALDLLVGNRSRDEDALVAVAALVVRRVDVDLLLLGGDRADRIPHRAGDRADDDVHLVALDQLSRLLDADLRIGLVILDEELQFAALDATAIVDLLLRELRAVQHRLAEDRVDPGERDEHAHLHRLCRRPEHRRMSERRDPRRPYPVPYAYRRF